MLTLCCIPISAVPRFLALPTHVFADLGFAPELLALDHPRPRSAYPPKSAHLRPSRSIVSHARQSGVNGNTTIMWLADRFALIAPKARSINDLLIGCASVAAATGQEPGRCNVSWHQASLSGETSRSLRCDHWETAEKARNVPPLPNFPITVSLQKAAMQADEVTKRRGRHKQDNDSEARTVALPVDAHRLIPNYRNGDRRVEAGRDLFSIGFDGKAIFNLLDGWVAIYTLLEDGRRQIVQFALPGAVLGVRSSRSAPATVGAQALTDVVVSVIPTPVLTSHSRADPDITMRLARSLAHDCNLAFDHLTSIGRRSARERVAHLLLELFTRYRAQWPGHRSEEMVLPLTQEQIGDATGLTFVHVNRVLSALRKEGIVQFHYRRLRIIDPDRLIEVAGVDPEIAMAWLERQPWG